MKINISKKDKAAVFKALYDSAKPQGASALQYKPGELPLEEARRIIETAKEFDYVFGRVMKIDLSGDEFDSWLYDRDNGEGSAKKAVDSVPDTL